MGFWNTLVLNKPNADCMGHCCSSLTWRCEDGSKSLKVCPCFRPEISQTLERGHHLIPKVTGETTGGNIVAFPVQCHGKLHGTSSESKVARIYNSVTMQIPEIDDFDLEGDVVGAIIYGGRVKRDANGEVIIGDPNDDYTPYEDGLIYAGGGYTELSEAIQNRGPEAVAELLKSHPQLAQEITTGAATPLHISAMSDRGEQSMKLLLEVLEQQGPYDVDTKDLWGYTALHRCAANNLPVGAQALLEAGADQNLPSGRANSGWSARQFAFKRRYYDVMRVIQKSELERGTLPEGEPLW